MNKRISNHISVKRPGRITMLGHPPLKKEELRRLQNEFLTTLVEKASEKKEIIIRQHILLEFDKLRFTISPERSVEDFDYDEVFDVWIIGRSRLLKPAEVKIMLYVEIDSEGNVTDYRIASRRL